jgi:ribonucleoside-triphosphate reductase
MRSERPDVARAYIRYRYKKEVARNFEHDFVDAVVEKLEASDVQNQNANVDEHSFGGRTGEASSVMTKRLALDHLISGMARENHLNNRIYIHDLDAYYVGSHNCLSIPFDDLLAKGFNTRQTDVRPAGSVNTACQLVAVIFQLQSLQQFGGVSATHIDWTMVPYIRKSFYKHFKDGVHYIEHKIIDCLTSDVDVKNIAIDSNFYKDLNCPNAYDYAIDMTEKEIHQAVEGLYHNLNTLQSRSGNQLPFTSINYGTCTLPEGRMFTRALLDVSIEGLGRLHKTSIFPCGIFQCMKGVNRAPGDPNYDLYRLALESTSRRLYPNYANVDWSGNAGYDINDPCTYFSTMGCRTVNGADINAEPGVNPQRKDGRGNICPVTIIMPTLAMEAWEKLDNQPWEIDEDGTEYKGGNVVDTFMELLDQAIYDAKDMLLERFEWICS